VPVPDGVAPASARAHVFVPDLAVPRLSDGDRQHLQRVLRLPPGAAVTVSDGRGGWRACRLGEGPALEIAGEVMTDSPARPAITVAFALVKGQRPELVVQKLTELGVDRIVPFVAERSVVHWTPDKVGRQAERFDVIAREAAMQSRRTFVPEVAGLSDFATVSAHPGAALADPQGGPPVLSLPTVLVGPEGGWSGTERTSGLPTVRLGAHTLRSETAAITAGAVLVALRSRLVDEVVPAQLERPHGP
jgi:16S rRNA (uracil1498-N3)-methyltransferase